MKFHYDIFTITTLDAWCQLHQPTSLELSDHQYFVLTGMLGVNVKEYKGIPIEFLNAPKVV
jgi:hypothetical protein